MSPLYGRMHAWMAEPFVWGLCDCMTVLADHVAEVTGRDPMAELRGTYSCAGSCQQVTGFLRDPVGAVERALATIGGLPRVEAPEAGDIAVIRRAGEPPCGALWLGTLWGAKGPAGATTLDPRIVTPLAIWRVGGAG